MTLFDQSYPESKWYASGSNNLIFALCASLHEIFFLNFFIECQDSLNSIVCYNFQKFHKHDFV